MKKTLTALFLLRCFAGLAQQITPLPIIKHKIKEYHEVQYALDTLKDLQRTLNGRFKDITTAIESKDLRTINKQIQSAGIDAQNEKDKMAYLQNTAEELSVKIAKTSTEIVAVEKTLDETQLPHAAFKLEQEARIAITGLGGVSNLADQKTANGNFAIGFRVRATKFKASALSRKWIDPLFVYGAINTKTHASADSLNIAKCILFPEISKRDMVIGLDWQWLRPANGLALELVAEASLNKYDKANDSTITNPFRTESLLIGGKISISDAVTVGTETTKAGFQFFPYYSIINIQPKYTDDYHKAVGKASAITWHCVGAQVAFQVSDLILFCNMKYILNKDNAERPQDLRGFTYCMGAMIAVDIFKVRTP